MSNRFQPCVRIDRDSTLNDGSGRDNPWAKLCERILDSPVLVRRTALLLVAATPASAAVIAVILVGR